MIGILIHSGVCTLAMAWAGYAHTQLKTCSSRLETGNEVLLNARPPRFLGEHFFFNNFIPNVVFRVNSQEHLPNYRLVSDKSKNALDPSYCALPIVLLLNILQCR